MKLRWPWVTALGLVLALALFAAWHFGRNRGEGEIIAWSQPATPALAFEGSLLRLLAAEGAARRALLLERCPVQVWSSPVRFANPKYADVMGEAGRAADKLLADAVESGEVLPNEWSTGAIEAWRSWSESQRQTWLTYMRSTDARRGSEWHWTMAAFDAFHEYAIDWNTGRPNPMWPAWATEFLAKAGLSAVFREAANAIETGLGDRFSAESARPVAYPVDETQQLAIADLIRRMKQRWPAVSQAVRARAHPDIAKAAHSWSSHPQVRAIEAVILEKRSKRSPEMSASLMSWYTRETDILVAIASVMQPTLRATAGTTCRRLQQ